MNWNFYLNVELIILGNLIGIVLVDELTSLKCRRRFMDKEKEAVEVVKPPNLEGIWPSGWERPAEQKEHPKWPETEEHLFGEWMIYDKKHFYHQCVHPDCHVIELKDV